jgi:DNA-binding MarR family transcriptional regulator
MTTTDDSRHVLDPRLAGHTGQLVRLASVRADTLVRAALPPGRTLRDLGILAVLADGPLSQAQLGTLLRVNRTVMISVIDGIEAADLLCRERDPADRRRYALRITDEGRAAVPRLHEAAMVADRELTSALDERQRGRLVTLLRSLVPDLVAPLPELIGTLPAFLLEQASQQLRTGSEQALTEQGIKPRCVRMLVALDAAQPCTQERLANAMSLAAPSIVAALDELRVNGLMLSDRNPSDRREQVLRLSGDGRRYLDDALRAEHAAQQRLAETIGSTEVDELNTLLSAVSTLSG